MYQTLNDQYPLALYSAIEVFRGKWKPYIIWHINAAPGGRIRYGALKRSLPSNISHKILSQNLHELESSGIVLRTEFAEKNLHVEYSLTPKGASLASIMYLLCDWSAMYGTPTATVPVATVPVPTSPTLPEAVAFTSVPA